MAQSKDIVDTAFPDLELFNGPASYHRIIPENGFRQIKELLDLEYLTIINEDYNPPDNSRLYWTETKQGAATYGTYTEPPVSETEVREKFEKKAYIEAEETTWKMVKDSENPDDLRFFLEQYPNSPYAAPARLKLKQLEREKN